MAGDYNEFVRRVRPSMQELDQPQHREEAAAQDSRPENVEELQRAMVDRRHQSPMQQQVLGDELSRIKKLQTLQLQRGAQAMSQQLEQSLSPAKTGEPWPSPEATMVRMMLQMQRRYPGMKRGPPPQTAF